MQFCSIQFNLHKIKKKLTAKLHMLLKLQPEEKGRRLSKQRTLEDAVERVFLLNVNSLQRQLASQEGATAQ